MIVVNRIVLVAVAMAVAVPGAGCVTAAGPCLSRLSPPIKMPAKSAWMAQQILQNRPLVGYADDLWAYEPATGLYHRLATSECHALVEQELVGLLGSSHVGSRYTSEVVDSLRNLSFIDDGKTPPPFWISTKARADVLVVANGVLSLSAVAAGGTVNLTPFTPTLFAVAGSPCHYQPGARCPKWRAFVAWMVRNNQDEQRLLAEFCAWPFVAHLPGMRLEHLLWLVGPGRNGKSLFYRVVRDVYGARNCSAVGLEDFTGGQTFRLAPALYKLANFSADSGVRRYASVAKVNAWLSGDPFEINRKFRDHLAVEPTTPLFVASNDPPAFHDPSDGIWRRLLVLRCDRKLTDRQAKPNLYHTLIRERDGILNWMLEALPALVARGKFDVPESVRANVEALKGEANVARQFLTEKVESAHPDCYLRSDQVMTEFVDWCERNAYRPENLTVVKQEMLRLFGSKYDRLRRGNPPQRVRLWLGVRWQTDPDANPFQDDPTLSGTEAALAEWNRRSH